MTKIAFEQGIVESVEVPDDWKPDEPFIVSDRITNVYRDSANREILFCSHFRGAPLADRLAATFQNVLYAAFHQLTPDEIVVLTPLLEAVSNERMFRVDHASTGYVNDRRAIRINGEWLDKNARTMSCFFDVAGDGRHVQNIYFCAPSAVYDQCSETAEKIFASIKYRRKEEL